MSAPVGRLPEVSPLVREPPTGEYPAVEVRTRLHSRGRRLADHLPPWAGSIRFRLTLVYSTVVFGLAALAVASLYFGLRYSLQNQTIGVVFDGPGGTFLQIDQAQLLQNQVNERALDALRVYSLSALLGLFFVSLAVGWLVSGRMLRPIGQITSTVREIQVSDLSRRIDLGGPDDELRRLADTFDGMLGRLDEAFEGQRQFIHEASHELRNPLAVIRTNLEVTLADPDASAEDLRRTAEVVERSTERMARLVDDLLVYARKGTLSLDRQPVDAASLVAEAADEFVGVAEAEGVGLDQVTDAGLWVLGDRLALRQALANLLANAVHHSPPGTTIRLRAGREGPWVWLSVEDQGPGIDPADQERVFQRFWRGNPREGRENGRSGLGLTIVRQTAEAHGGEVKLASVPGQGAAFALWLPALPPPSAPSSG
ncbi:MAG: HAMP domain-containing histidine kinase [Acidimicrobiales bacterium]|nr:HAMP domain-containing histidine kinase [Acidimicrobiales bacterium]